MTVKEESVIVLWGDGFCFLPSSPKIVVSPLAAPVKALSIVSVTDVDEGDSVNQRDCREQGELTQWD